MNTTSSFQRSDSVDVEPSRLARGHWCHRGGRQQGEGDISASYSADLICSKDRVRQPFALQGWSCVVTGIGRGIFTAYRLLPFDHFDGDLTNDAEKVGREGDEARSDPNGFHHGMQVEQGGQRLVLSGPPIEITAGEPEPEQTDLFG